MIYVLSPLVVVLLGAGLGAVLARATGKQAVGVVGATVVVPALVMAALTGMAQTPPTTQWAVLAGVAATLGAFSGVVGSTLALRKR